MQPRSPEDETRAPSRVGLRGDAVLEVAVGGRGGGSVRGERPGRIAAFTQAGDGGVSRRSARGMCGRFAARRACEHVFVMYGDGLLLLFELADREDERFQLAAARWHARFVLEARLPLRKAEGVLTLLCRLRGADRLVVRRRLLALVERAGLTASEIRTGT